MTRVPRLTVRLTQERRDAYRALCARNGISQQAGLAAYVHIATTWHDHFGGQPVERWEPNDEFSDEMKAMFVGWLETARGEDVDSRSVD